MLEGKQEDKARIGNYSSFKHKLDKQEYSESSEEEIFEAISHTKDNL